MLHVVVDLSGTGAAPEDVYARRIVAGWVFPDEEPVRHLQLTLTKMILDNNHEAKGFNGEFTFLFMNLNRAPDDEWYRLADFDIPTSNDESIICGRDHINTLEDYDDDDDCGEGPLNFAGPTFDFYLHPEQPFRVMTSGFEQDCRGKHGFGSGEISLPIIGACYIAFFDEGKNDAIAAIDAAFPFGVDAGGKTARAGSDFDLLFRIDEVPLIDEDTADLGVSKSCTHTGEVALAGVPFTCSIQVGNPGPGLPRQVAVVDTVAAVSGGGTASISNPRFALGDNPVETSCGLDSAAQATCDLGTALVGDGARIEASITAHAAGTYTNTAVASTDSVDPDAANNRGEATVEVFQPVDVSVKPSRKPPSALNPTSRGDMGVAILTTTDFDATTIDPSTICFGDAGTPAERDCTETHGRGHLEDVDHDGDRDLLLHYETTATGIDSGDATACVIGRTFGGIGIYGCGPLVGL
jgi:hypothetical protein